MLFSQSVPAAQAATVCNSALFVSDLTIPDGSSIAPGTVFQKTWRLLNNGTCTWTTSYKLTWVGGDQMASPLAQNLPVSVPPGQMLDLTVQLTAPPTNGHYKAFFKLRNTAGTQFGIGGSANEAFWVDINVVDLSAVIYDFVTNAPYAQWKSGAGALPFPGTSGDFRGYSSVVSSPHLEDDSYDTAPGLLTVPQNRLNGYIQATYPEFQIQAGDKLQTMVNCEFGATGCYATFRIDYILPNNAQRTLWTWREAYDRRFYRASLDLSALAGQKVRFVFMLLSSGAASGDRAIWGSPRIVRAGAGQPPSPPATLTPLPPLTPTATPLVSPPPTIASTGCDKATFISDVTVQDGAIFAPGAAFTKTWRLKNSGSCVWTTAYRLVYYSGDQMGAPPAVNLPWGAAPGQTVDISVNMTAPMTATKYRGYWILVNANGQYFGIGAGASEPIWVEINVSGDSPDNAVYYDFLTNACSAEWKNTAGILLCPGTDGDAQGFVLSQNPARLEDGSASSPGLLTFPQNRYNGYIQGFYPTFTVQPGDRFQTSTSCEFGSSCSVTFRLDYLSASGAISTFWQWREQSDGRVNPGNVDLTPLAGRSVRFILTVLATGSAANDRAIWAAPRILRAPSTPPTLTPSPTVTPLPPVVSFPHINKLFMFDAVNGWAVGSSYVLRTFDGGATWYNFSMPGISSIRNVFFQNSTKGWVLATVQDTNAPALFRTTNGGLTWTTYNNIPFNGGVIQFLDDNNGFVMSGLPSGMQKHPIQIYQTTNGGAEWTLKSATDPYQPNNIPPFGGIKNGMSFRNTSTGWIGGNTPTDGFPYFYKTNNSGVSWVHQPLSLPAGYQSAFLDMQAPTFFSATDGVLPVWMSIGIGMRDLFIYTTRDGGTTWARSTSFARNGSNVDFVSIRDAFSWNWAGFFQVTNDGGRTWREVTPNVSFGESIGNMDFVSLTTGWVFDVDEFGNTALYRTNDGGSTWTLLFGNIPPQPRPDLTISSMRIELQNTSCLLPGDIMGVRVGIANQGQEAAGSFVVRVNNNDQTVNGLGAGETTVLFFPTSINPVTAIADATGTIQEGNENNNVRSEMLPVPTPPPPCATPTELLQTIVNTMNARNFDTVRNTMGESFVIAYWQSQGTAYPPDQASEGLKSNFSTTTMLAADPSKNLTDVLNGFDPYSRVGLDPARSQALYVSGWGPEGKGEAILYVTQRPDGRYYFHSVLIAPTGFAPPPTTITLTGPYAVVHIGPNEGLDIRSGAGADQPVIGSFASNTVNVMRTGPTVNADNANWVEVQHPNGGEGWVNSYYLTEYVTHDDFCLDGRASLKLEQLMGSMNQSNGDMFAAIVSPASGVNVHLWPGAPANNFNTTTARNVFISMDVLNWGTGAGQGGPDPVLGTFSQVIQPKMLEVINSLTVERYCDDLTQVFNPPLSWRYNNIRFYHLYKPSTPGNLDFRSWLIGFEYINGEPYLYTMVTVVGDP
jgi:photosystem II stability/assembly factor-like uncharacterized protein